MNIFPFEKVVGVPCGTGERANILNSGDLIDVMDSFKFQTMRATNKPYYRGVSGYLFDAQIHIGFGGGYEISDVELRHPFTCLEGEGIFWGDVNLICSTLLEVRAVIESAGISTKATDVGLDAPDIGVSFFSSDYESDLNVRLDAVTVHLRKPA